MRLWWKDPALAYNGTADGGCIDALALGPEERNKVWRPNLYWEMAKGITLPELATVRPVDPTRVQGISRMNGRMLRQLRASLTGLMHAMWCAGFRKMWAPRSMVAPV